MFIIYESRTYFDIFEKNGEIRERIDEKINSQFKIDKSKLFDMSVNAKNKMKIYDEK